MNLISNCHRSFSNYLSDPKVLTNPEVFLGPNFEAVLNYWLILDGLSKDQWKTIAGRSDDFCYNPRSKWARVTDEVFKASEETIGREFANFAARAAYDVYVYYAARWATRELIGMHLLLDQQKPLTFFPMFLEVL